VSAEPLEKRLAELPEELLEEVWGELLKELLGELPEELRELRHTSCKWAGGAASIRTWNI
jgi:hypothetical protein